MQGLVHERRNVEDTLLRPHREYGHADDENREDQQERVIVASSPEHKRRVHVITVHAKIDQIIQG